MADDKSSEEYRDDPKKSQDPSQENDEGVVEDAPADAVEESRDTGPDIQDEKVLADHPSDEEGEGDLPDDAETSADISGDDAVVGSEDASEDGSVGGVADEDEIGISLSDDELWDEGDDLDEIPLFEEEEEKDGAEAGPVDEAMAFSLQDEQEGHGESENESSDHSSPEDTESPGAGGHVLDDKEDEAEGHGAEVMSQAVLSRWMPWIVTGISAFLFIIGIVVLCMIWPSSEDGDRATEPVRAIAPKTGTNQVKTAREPKPAAGVESINLEPFLLPARQEGELVFIKLYVELIVPDMQTKKSLMLKQAWVRDTIYQELKDITVPAGKGDMLSMYRRSLIRKLNEEFKPLRIKDLRLSGYLLR